MPGPPTLPPEEPSMWHRAGFFYFSTALTMKALSSGQPLQGRPIPRLSDRHVAACRFSFLEWTHFIG